MFCKLGKLMANRDAMPAPDFALLTGWLEHGCDGKGRRVSGENLAAALVADYGPDAPGPTTLKDHRGGRCACYRKVG